MNIFKKGFTDSKGGIMPSVFTSLDSKVSRPLTSRQELENWIRHNKELAGLTDAYRKGLAVSKQLASKTKMMSPALCVAAQLDGKGRQLENVVAEVNSLALDYDDIPEEKMQEVFKRIKLAANTTASWITMSSHGRRIIVSYERPSGCDLSFTELHKVMMQKAIKFYDTLLGIKADRQATDFLRLCGLAHDPDAYFNWDAVPITLSNDEVLSAKAEITFEEQETKKNSAEGNGGKKSYYAKEKEPKLSTKVPTMKEAEQHILETLKNWGLVFESHRHNEYVSTFGYLCVRYGINLQEAFDYADFHFSDEYPDTMNVMKSCYRHKERLGTWHFFRKGESYKGQSSIKMVKQWILSRYQVQRNLVTGRHQITSRLVDKPKYLSWVNLDDDILNSLWLEMEEDGLHFSLPKLFSLIHSDFAEKCDPLKEYLQNLPNWDGFDYIGELADRIHIIPEKGYYHDQSTFRKYLRKWIVAMVVGWIRPDSVNQMMLILVGKGGIFKTTFFNYLLPPSLREYYLNESAAIYTDKDHMESFACKALLCMDEFDSTIGRNLNAFKSNITKLQFSIRRPYDRFRSDLMHRASVAGTTNNQQIITDLENRRYSPWLVESIESPIDKPFNYTGIYSQAVALGKAVKERQEKHEEGWVYWLTASDIIEMQSHNRLFMVPNYAEEQIKRFYRVPEPDTPKQFIKFRYTAEILERISTNPAMRSNLEHQSIGGIMSRLKFPKGHRKKGNGWYVVEIEGAEQECIAKYDPEVDKDDLPTHEK